MARQIHNHSPRREHPFLAVNCAALTETLLESELFGHEKGAFTDAHQQKKGLFERAHHSTLLLDEIGDTSLALQAKILRALQEREIMRVGGTEAIKEFQRAQNNPHRRISAMSHLGQCFAKRGMNDLAARRFQEAIKEKLVFDDEKKDLIYNLGSVLEKMGKAEEAIEQFKLIYEVDISYRDVGAKVDAYYAGR